MHIVELIHLPPEARQRIENLRDWSFTRRTLLKGNPDGFPVEGDEGRAKGLITREAEKVIWEHAFSEATGEPNTSGITIEATEDRVTLRTPALTAHFPDMRIKVQRQDLAPGINALVKASSPSSR